MKIDFSSRERIRLLSIYRKSVNDSLSQVPIPKKLQANYLELIQCFDELLMAEAKYLAGNESGKQQDPGRPQE